MNSCRASLRKPAEHGLLPRMHEASLLGLKMPDMKDLSSLRFPSLSRSLSPILHLGVIFEAPFVKNASVLHAFEIHLACIRDHAFTPDLCSDHPAI